MGTDGEQRLTADVREETKKALRRINLVRGRDTKKPTEELKAQILEWYSKVINTTYLADNHNKVLLVRSEKGEVVSIVTSQNLTQGNRCDSTFIIIDLGVFNTLHGQIEVFIKTTPFA